MSGWQCTEGQMVKSAAKRMSSVTRKNSALTKSRDLSAGIEASETSLDAAYMPAASPMGPQT